MVYNVGLEHEKVTKLCRDMVEELVEEKWPGETTEEDRVREGNTKRNSKFQGERASEMLVGLDAVGLLSSIYTLFYFRSVISLTLWKYSP